MSEPSQINIKTPGRICLFGDHQDYLGLPVIACAFNRSVTLTAQENGEAVFRISLPDIGQERIIPISERFDSYAKEDYFASGLETLRANGMEPNMGYDVCFTSDLPINAGVSSSSAIVVAWIHFLLKAFNLNQEPPSQQIAQMAYQAEVVAHNSPGGRMDQYSIAIGDIVYIDTSEDASYEIIGNQLDGLVLGESGEPKETIGLLQSKRRMAEEAIAIVKEKDPNFKLENAYLHDAEAHSRFLPKELAPYFYGAIKNHSITKQAYVEFKKDEPNAERLGSLMNAHHEVLKNNLKLTLPVIDKMIEASLEAGAYGAKIVGSGLGGSIVALCPPHKMEAVVEAIKLAGGKDAYPVYVNQGTNTN
ncbi:MAG: galactokinase [Candidatus Latescibacterota bacterium]|jgi:galactokinase